MKRFGIIFLLFISTMIIGIGFAFWKPSKPKQEQQPISAQVTQDLEDARNLLSIFKPRETLMLVEDYKDDIQQESPLGKVWLDIFIQATIQQDNIAQLIQLYEFSPEAFDSYEDTAQTIADAYLDLGKARDYEGLRNRWKGRENNLTKWQLLDADKYILDGQRNRAIVLLTTKQYKGEDETQRLMKLSLLNAQDAPYQAWEYLELAKEHNPNDPDLFLYRGEFQELLGNFKQAEKEYTQASSLDPDNLVTQDQVADFYVRIGEPKKAVAIWKQHLNPPSLDTIWLKTIFWSKVLAPIDFNWKTTHAPEGTLTPLITYLINLKPEEFWNDEKFTKLSQKELYVQTRQETYWLKLLEELRSNDMREVSILLKYNPFDSQSWNPDLEQALKHILTYRQNETFLESKSFNKNHLLFQTIEDLSLNPDISKGTDAFIQDKEIFSTIALASGWQEAGLNLHRQAIIPDDYPDYVTTELVQAIKNNRDDFETMDFALLQKETPELSLILGQLLIEGGNINQGMEKLEPLVTQSTQAGADAALYLSRYYFNRSNYLEATDVIHNNPIVDKHASGIEILARIAHNEGDVKESNRLYSSIEKQSIEAKSYLAKRAYADKDWKRARELTEALLQEYPNNTTLKHNLDRIIRKEKASRD